MRCDGIDVVCFPSSDQVSSTTRQTLTGRPCHPTRHAGLTRYNKIASFGCVVAFVGLLVGLGFYFFTPVYSGASGAGMAGLGAGLAILAGLILMAGGSVIAVIAFLLGLIRTSRRQ